MYAFLQTVRQHCDTQKLRIVSPVTQQMVHLEPASQQRQASRAEGGGAGLSAGARGGMGAGARI